MGKRTGRAALVAVLVVGVPASPAVASTLTVTTMTDEVQAGDGLCSLREAIAAVDTQAATGDCGAAAFGPNTIALGPHAYELSIAGASAGNATGDLNVASSVSDLTIAGAGESATVIDATGLGDRVIEIDPGATVTLSGLTLTGGHAPDGSAGSPGTNGANSDPGGGGGPGGPGEPGGAIENAGTLTLRDAAVTGNRAGAGGSGGRGGDAELAVGGQGGSGGSGAGGGGILNTGSLTVIEATISSNRSGAGGAGGDGGDGDTAGASGGVGGAGGRRAPGVASTTRAAA